jgi:hypothetical protein
MPDYTKNFENTVGGHTGDENMTVKSTKGKLADLVHTRDAISALVGAGGIQNLRPDDRKAVNAALSGYLGQQQATKLIDQISIFNQRPDQLQKSATDRINSFFTIGSRDPQIDAIIKQTGNAGQGAVADASQTSNDLTKKVAAGADVLTPPPASNINAGITAAQNQLGTL